MKRATLSAVLAAALTLPMPLAMAVTVTGTIDQQAISAISGSQTVDLTITKAKTNPYDQVTPKPAGGVEGFTFSIQRVDGIDLTTERGWEEARRISIDQARNRLTGPVRSAVTDSTGSVTFNGLGVGLYLVTEKPPADDNYTWSWGPPFLLTLPTGNAEGTQWDYDVEVIAKSVPDGVPDDYGSTPTPEVPPQTPPRDIPPGDTPPGDTPPGETPPRNTPPGDTPPGATPTTTPSAPVPGSPGSGEDGGTPSWRDRELPSLANTGASILGVVALGALLVALGGFLVRRRQAEEDSAQ